MKLSLSALLALAIVALTTDFYLDYNALYEQDAMDLAESNATAHKPAMKMYLWGGIRATNRPAAVFGHWNEDVFLELVTENNVTL